MHTFIHRSQRLPRHIGSSLGFMSCPKILRHSDQGNWTTDLPITSWWLCPWATKLVAHKARGVASWKEEKRTKGKFQKAVPLLLSVTMRLQVIWITILQGKSTFSLTENTLEKMRQTFKHLVFRVTIQNRKSNFLTPWSRNTVVVVFFFFLS